MLRADNLHDVFMEHLRGRSVRSLVIIRLFHWVDASYGTEPATFFWFSMFLGDFQGSSHMNFEVVKRFPIFDLIIFCG